MPGQTNQPNRRPKASSPAERAVEFTATQRRLKQEAADRRKAAEAKRDDDAKSRPRG